MKPRTNKLAEETVNFEAMCLMLDEGFENEPEPNEEEIDDFGDPMNILMFKQEMEAAKAMKAKREPRSLGVVRRSKV